MMNNEMSDVMKARAKEIADKTDRAFQYGEITDEEYEEILKNPPKRTEPFYYWRMYIMVPVFDKVSFWERIFIYAKYFIYGRVKWWLKRDKTISIMNGDIDDHDCRIPFDYEQYLDIIRLRLKLGDD